MSKLEIVERRVTPEEVAFYDEHGWVFLPELIPSRLATELLGLAEELRKKVSGGQYTRGLDHAQIIAEPEIEIARALAIHRTAGENAHAFMGRPTVRKWASWLLCKTPVAWGESGAQETPWHQDDQMSPRDRSGHVNIWTSLVHATPEMGTMRFVTGSHKEGNLGATQFKPSESDEEMRRSFVDFPRIARLRMSPPFTYRPGDATAHSGLTLHSAPKNVTNNPRWAFLRAYFPGDTRYIGSGMLGDDRDPRELGMKPYDAFDRPEFPLVYS